LPRANEVRQRILAIMRFLFTACCILFNLGLAQQEIVGTRVRVLFENPLLESYAQQVALDAETALDILSQYFGEPKQPITITINNNSDVFNAFGSPLPRPKASVRALFPSEGLLGFGAKSELFLLLIHELTHVTQLTYTEIPEDAVALPQLGLVGENTAQVPPMWFLEGIAVWIESEYTEGGRREDALTQGLLETLALSEDFPTLTEVSLSSFGDWPGGNARYLLGVSFLQHLIDAYGVEAVLATLRDYNAGFVLTTFADAWQRVTGANLFTDWETWREDLKAKTEERTKELPEENLLTATGWYTGAPTLSPDGKQLAWLSYPPKIVVADVVSGELENERTIIDRRFPDSLEWQDNKTLLYSRIVRRPGTEYLELFSLDVATGKETQLTEDARAHFPNIRPDGCILFVRDLPYEGSSLRTFCDGTISTFWQAPEGLRVVGLDVSVQGKILLSLWRDGKTDIALLKNNELSFLTHDDFQDIQPSWQATDEILFVSNRDGMFELYSLTLEPREPVQPLGKLTNSPGAATQATSNGGDIFYVTLGANGYNLAVTKEQAELVVLANTTSVIEPLGSRRPTFAEATGEPNEENLQVDEVEKKSVQQPANEQLTFAVRTYSPWQSLLPYGWLPTMFGVSFSPFGFSLGASVYGLDDLLEHGYSLNASYDTSLCGHLGGAALYVAYEHHANTVYTQLLPPYPASFGVRFGVWEHTPHLLATTETALGFETTFRVTLPVDRWNVRASVQAGLLHLQSYGKLQAEFRFDASLSQQFSDDWGYRTRGPRFAVTGLASATPKGASFGAWFDASYYQFFSVFDVSGTLELALRTGYRPARVIPVSLNNWAAYGTLGYRISLPVEWRLGDGRYALERVTLEPRLRPYFDGTFGVGADVTLNADTVIGYGAPTTFGVTLGYAQNSFWSSFGLRLPL
jgi:WD40-like Beta Propeller Repeat